MASEINVVVIVEPCVKPSERSGSTPSSHRDSGASNRGTTTSKCGATCSGGGAGKGRTMSAKCMKGKGRVLSILLAIREPIADYQQKGGLGRYEQVGFLCLLTSIYQQAYQACLAFLTMLCNLLPFIDVFLLVVRFSLDKLICIVKTDNTGTAIVGGFALISEVIVVTIFLWLICMFLLVPVLSLVLSFVYRLLGMN